MDFDFMADLKHMMSEEAKLEGILEGKREGRAAMLLDLLAARFGKLPAAVRARIDEADEKVLSTWALRVLTAKTLAEVLDGEAAAPAPKARTTARSARKRH